MTIPHASEPCGPPPGLFFAGSDDEGEDIRDTDMLAEEANPSSPKSSSSPAGTSLVSSRSSPMIQKLFLDDEDDIDDIPTLISEPPSPHKLQVSDTADSDIEIIEQPTGFRERETKAGTAKISGKSKRSQSAASPSPVAKKRRVSPVQTPDHMPQTVLNFTPTYLGEVLVPNAWSNVSGKGYIKANDRVIVRRDEDAPMAGPSKAKPPAKEKKSDKKQITLSTMLKTQSSKPSRKKKTDTIVRLINSKGFGVYCILG